ncbi:ankyrin repeat-containing protein [Coniothyrium glycines]
MARLDDESIDDLLYLARANEPVELASLLSHLAAQTKQSQGQLLAAAVDPYTKNSALHYAAANGHTEIIQLLLRSSTGKPAPAVIINALNDAGNTALHWAALNGHLESVKLLVASGADVTIINRAGHDAVFEAEINDKKEVVDWLLGAVEELEHGIGQTRDDAGAEHADQDMHDADEAAIGQNAQDAAGEAGEEEEAVSVSSVEHVRKQLEDINTTKGTDSQGG